MGRPESHMSQDPWGDPYSKWDDKLTLGVNRALNLFWNSTEDELVQGRKGKR